MVLRERVQAGGGGGSDTGGRGAQLTQPVLLSIMWLSLTSLCCEIRTHSTTGPAFRKQLHHQSYSCFINSSFYRVLMLLRFTAAADHQLSMLQHSLSPSASWTSRKGAGPHIRTVPSSEALASSPGKTGFQLTQLTVRVWPVNSAMGSSLRRCQM